MSGQRPEFAAEGSGEPPSLPHPSSASAAPGEALRTSARRRILFDGLPLGERPSGIRTRLLGLLPELARWRGLEVGLVAGPGLSVAERELLSGVQVLPGPALPEGSWRRWRVRRAALSAAARAFRADRLVVDALPWPEHPGLVGMVHDLRRRKVLGLRGLLYRRTLLQGLHRATRVHVPSEATASKLRQLAHEEQRDLPPLAIVPNGVDGARFQPWTAEGDAELLQARGLRSGRYLLWVGHFEQRKEPHLALALRAELASRSIDLPIVMVGRGELLPEESLVHLAAQHPAQDLGQVLRDAEPTELPVLYRHAAAVLATAREEGFGIVPLEALASGVPVIASDIAAHREVLAGSGALLVTSGPGPGWVAALLGVIEGERVGPLEREAGLARATEFSWEASARAFVEDLLEEATEGGAGTLRPLNPPAR